MSIGLDRSAGPLSGLLVDASVAQAVRDLHAQPFQPTYEASPAFRMANRIQAGLKLGKTVLTPTTAIRNIWGNIPMAIQNGDFDPLTRSWREAAKDAMETMAVYHDTQGKRRFDKAKDEEIREWLALQTRRGIINDSARGEEIVQAFRDVEFRDGAYRILSDPSGAGAVLAAGAAERAALAAKFGVAGFERFLHIAKRFLRLRRRLLPNHRRLQVDQPLPGMGALPGRKP